MAYCGSPEPLDKTETGAHGIFYGEINPSTLLVTKLEFIPMSKLRYIPLIVNVTPATTNTELCLKMSHEIDKRGTDNIYRFRVRGMRDPDITFDLDSLLLRYKISDILDESEPEYDFSALFAEHPSDMIGFYIRALQKPDMSPVEKRRCFTESMPCFSQPMKELTKCVSGFIISGFGNFITRLSPLRTASILSTARMKQANPPFTPLSAECSLASNARGAGPPGRIPTASTSHGKTAEPTKDSCAWNPTVLYTALSGAFRRIKRIYHVNEPSEKRLSRPRHLWMSFWED